MGKISRFVKCLFAITAILVFARILLFSRHDKKIVSQGSFEAIQLHSDEGHYITFAIKKKTNNQTWDYVVPQWFSKYFGVNLFWCNDCYDFVIYSGDTGNHLYIYDSLTKTWHDGYYIRPYDNNGESSLFIWKQSDPNPIEPYPIERIPEEVLDQVMN